MTEPLDPFSTNPPEEPPKDMGFSGELSSKPQLPDNKFKGFKAAKRMVHLKRSTWFWIAIVSLSVTFGVTTYFVMDRKAKLQDKRYQEILKKFEKSQAELKGLSKKFEDIEVDRNNILAQTKGLLAEKMKWSDIEENLKESMEINERFTSQKNKLHEENLKIQNDLASLQGHFNRLKNAYSDLQAKDTVLDQENASLKAALARKIKDAPEYRNLERESKAVKTENAKLKNTVKNLDAQLKRSLGRIAKIQDRDKKFAKQAQGLKNEIAVLNSEKNNLIKTNQVMNKVAAEAPERFKDIAKQNRELIKETSEIHYNLGVFYAQNRKTDLAIKELRRAVDIDPNNAKAHYNLGYLYSEELNNQADAVTHFEKFLEISPNSKEAETVRSYIVSNRAYQGKAT